MLIGIRGDARFLVESAISAGLSSDAAFFFEDPEQAGLHLRINRARGGCHTVQRLTRHPRRESPGEVSRVNLRLCSTGFFIKYCFLVTQRVPDSRYFSPVRLRDLPNGVCQSDGAVSVYHDWALADPQAA